MKYCIPDLAEDDYKAVGKIIFDTNDPFEKVEIKSYSLPSGKILNVTYTTARTGFEVSGDEWVTGTLSDLPDSDYDYIIEHVLYQPSESSSGEVVLPSGKIVKISPGVD